MHLAEGDGVGVDLDRRFVGRDAGVFGERCAEDEEEVGLIHDPAGDGGAAAAEDAAAERMVIGDEALGFEGGNDGRVESLGEGGDVVHREARTVADDDGGSIRFAKFVDGIVERRSRGRKGVGGKTANGG